MDLTGLGAGGAYCNMKNSKNPCSGGITWRGFIKGVNTIGVVADGAVISALLVTAVCIVCVGATGPVIAVGSVVGSTADAIGTFDTCVVANRGGRECAVNVLAFGLGPLSGTGPSVDNFVDNLGLATFAALDALIRYLADLKL